jgi:hypothetical protein
MTSEEGVSMGYRTALKATTTVETVVDVKLQPKVKTMILDRCKEHQRLAEQMRGCKARQKRIKEEVEELFIKAKEGKALANGTEVEGHKLKLVCGTRKTLNKTLLVELGCAPEWLAEATEEQDNEPYVRISAPGEKDED